MATIFICYRRDDSGPAAGRIYDRLETHFGRGRVFMDVDDIPLGVDWRDWLDQQVRGSDLESKASALAPATKPERRLEIGDRLAELGDPRPGVGLGADGRPAIDWVALPAGSFLYGENKERREHDAFRISRFPITNAQYQAFIAADGYREKRWWEGLEKRIESPADPGWKQPNRPRESVSWYEAMTYCAWLSDTLKLEVRLPTEWEWERAARGTDGREYPWGDGYRAGYANIDEKNSDAGPTYLRQTTAVGVYPQGASPEGVLDLSGNVWEWCLNESKDPKRIQPGGTGSRVVRGGSWSGSQRNARAAYRSGAFVPHLRFGFLGLRVLCVSPIH